jgi:hypothetical protein
MLVIFISRLHVADRIGNRYAVDEFGTLAGALRAVAASKGIGQILEHLKKIWQTNSAYGTVWRSASLLLRLPSPKPAMHSIA